MMMRIRIGAAFTFIGSVFLGLLAFSMENHLTRWLFALGAVVQISYAFVLILRPGWVYKDI